MMWKKQPNLLSILISVTLLSLPLYVIRCSSFSLCVSPVPFTLLEILILVTFGYWFYLQIRAKNLKQKVFEIQNKIPKTIQVFIFIFLLSGLIGGFVSPDLRAGLGIYKAYFLEGFLLSVVVFDYLQTTKNSKLIVWSLICSALWVAVIAILNNLLNYNPGNPIEFLERGRASAVYTTSNAVGLLLGPATALMFGYLLSLKNTKKSVLNEKNLALFILVILVLGVWVSGSRGAFVGIFAGFLFFLGYKLYSRFSNQNKKFLARVFNIGLIIFSAIIFLFFLNISVSAKNPPRIPVNFQSSFNSRLCLWDGAVRIIKERPLFGSGLSGFEKVHEEFRTCSRENSIYPHNIFLNFWTEVGLFGLVSFIGMCTLLFYGLLAKKLDYLNLGIASILVVILFHGLVDVPFFKNDLSVQMWAILALGLYRLEES